VAGTWFLIRQIKWVEREKHHPQLGKAEGLLGGKGRKNGGPTRNGGFVFAVLGTFPGYRRGEAVDEDQQNPRRGRKWGRWRSP